MEELKARYYHRKEEMGNQKTVIIGEEPKEVVSGPVAEHHGKKKSKGKDQKEKVEEQVKEKKFAKDKEELEVGVEEEKKIENEIGESVEKGETPPEPKKKEKQGKAKIRSKKYQKVNKLVDHNIKYELEDAIELVKKTSMTKFDGNVEVHIRLLAKSGKPEAVRGLIKYPHSTGKTVNVVVIDEKVAQEIEKTKKANADIYLATPEMMPKIAKLAKILGPKGKMPNPKSGTITENPLKAQEEMAGGQVEYKTDKFGNLHQIIGKVSFDNAKLQENFKALLAALAQDKIAALTLCATMGPGVKVKK